MRPKEGRRYAVRKQIITHDSQVASNPEPDWLDLEHMTQVEVTSEESAHSIRVGIDTRNRLGLTSVILGSGTEKWLRAVFSLGSAV
jgi:hypothetical protein